VARFSCLVVVVLLAIIAAGCGKTNATTTARTTTIEATPVEASASVYRVRSESMAPTFRLDANALVRPLKGKPELGEIVVFHPPVGAEQEQCGPAPHLQPVGGAACVEPVPDEATERFIKRIVAGPGNVISIVEGHVIRNGVREDEPYIKRCGAAPECNFTTPIRIPPGHWFVLGDNRGDSDDSRFWGPIPTSWIVGSAVHCVILNTTCEAAR